MRVVRLVDEADWKSLWPLSKIFFSPQVAFRYLLMNRHVIHSKRGGLIATSITTSIVFSLPVPTIAGCLEDPTLNPLFNDLGYYKAFVPLCALYPCHLHINVSADYRNHGVGATLIEAFAEQASTARAPGMHIVTNEGGAIFASTSATTFAFFRPPIRTVSGLFSWGRLSQN